MKTLQIAAVCWKQCPAHTFPLLRQGDAPQFPNTELLILPPHQRWEVWVLANFRWCEPFFSFPPEVSWSTETRSTIHSTSWQENTNIASLTRAELLPTFLSDLVPVQSSSRSMPLVLFLMGAMLSGVEPGYWLTGGWTPKRAVRTCWWDRWPTNPSGQQSSQLLSDAHRGLRVGLYVALFTCQLVGVGVTKDEHGEDTPPSNKCRKYGRIYYLISTTDNLNMFSFSFFSSFRLLSQKPLLSH